MNQSNFSEVKAKNKINQIEDSSYYIL